VAGHLGGLPREQTITVIRGAAEGQSCMSDDTDQRLVNLEAKLSHHERMAEELSEVVAYQAQTIDTLTTQVRVLQERLAEIAAGWSRSPQDDKPPPHY
jgi:SlyX protein